MKVTEVSFKRLWTNKYMKVEEIFPKTGINMKRAKKIRAKLKDKAKKNNPGENEHRGGWGADPHQGSYNSLRMGASL